MRTVTRHAEREIADALAYRILQVQLPKSSTVNPVELRRLAFALAPVIRDAMDAAIGSAAQQWPAMKSDSGEHYWSQAQDAFVAALKAGQS